MCNNMEKLACEYFLFFSKLEYALKESKYKKKRSNNDNAAEVDWEKFKAKAESCVTKESLKRLTTEAVYFIDEPPKKQIVDAPYWDEISVSSVSQIIAACKRARNNLFHGGKSADSGSDEDRNKKLLQGAIDILRHIISQPCFSSVKTCFDGAVLG